MGNCCGSDQTAEGILSTPALRRNPDSLKQLIDEEPEVHQSTRTSLNYNHFVRLLAHKEADMHYRKEKLLGSGAFGEVYKCINEITKQTYAIKIVKKSSLIDPVLDKLIRQELSILAGISHPNIMRIYELLEDEVNYYVVSELITGGELQSVILKKKQHSVKWIAKIIKEVLLALNHMHNQNLIHRDIKPQNILMQGSEGIKLVDFGFAVRQEMESKERLQVGTPRYMAPEIVMGKKTSTGVDIWALGIITYFMSTGEFPYDADTQTELFEKIKNQPFKIPQNLQENLKQFIQQCLEKDVLKRPTAEQLLKSQFIALATNTQEHSKDELSSEVIINVLIFNKQNMFQRAINSYITTMLATNRQLESLKIQFLQLDKTQDGFLSYEEVDQAIRLSLGAINALSLKHLFEQIDSNNDGKIEYREFLNATVQFDSNNLKEYLKEAFQMIDTDDDGFIDQNELETLFTGPTMSTHETEWSQMIKEVDKNGDGKINLEEFCDYMHHGHTQKLSTLKSFVAK